MKPLFLCALIVAIVSTTLGQKTEFSGDRAYENLKVIAGEIGPRPMGSPAEQRALAFAVSKFKEYGCQDAYVMPMTVAGGVNTASGVAVGVRTGKTGRIIVIGGHMDSAGPDNPGANDDGSGAVTVIELARVLCRRQNESTVVFCCWGGEEEGLRGSRHFVDHFAQIDSVVLMLQIDMADGSGYLEIDPDGPYQVSAPRWLTRAVFEVTFRELGYSNVRYLTQSRTLNSAGSGVSGSDHEPFLQKGIPAIDFTSDVTYPIHTPLDNLQRFNPTGLARSGDIVLKVFERFDGGIPSRETEMYYLLQFGSQPVFFSYWMLWLFVATGVGMGVGALLVLLKRRPQIEREKRIRWSGLKILFFVIVIQSFIWLSENVVGLIRGYRYPWVNNYGGFVALGILAGLAGLWLMMKLSTRWRITVDPFVLYLRAFVFLFIAILVLALTGPELPIYPACSLLLLALAMVIRQPLVKFIFALAAPCVLLRLVFIEDLGLYLRALSNAPVEPEFVIITHLVFIGFFTLLSLPFAFGLVAVNRDARFDWPLMRTFRTGIAFSVLLVTVVLWAGYLATRTVYDQSWERDVRVEQRYRLGSDSSVVQVRSSEYLDGLKVMSGSGDTVLHGRNVTFAPVGTRAPVVSWLTVGNSDSVSPDSIANDSTIVMHRKLVLRSMLRPFTVDVRYYSHGLMNLSSPWSIGARRRLASDSQYSRTLSWYSFPDSVIVIPVTFAVKNGEKIAETVTVTYDTLSYPLRAGREFTYVSYRTVVTASDTLLAHVGGSGG